MRKIMILAAVLTVMGAATAQAQGIVVNKTDGTRVYHKASEIESVTTYGYGEESYAPAGAEAVDLGLPSGTKWANMNVGANKPEEYGDYFAWGESKTKDVYDWSTYIHSGDSEETRQELCSDIAGTEYDAATVNWGPLWKMPTKEQCRELLDNCTMEWTQQNGVYGRKFTGPNGGTIFLPAAGVRNASNLYGADSRGDYWSSTVYGDDWTRAWYLHFESAGLNSGDSSNGRSVRPVCSK